MILLVDAVTNGLWAFMWFVCFCFTTNQLTINPTYPPLAFDSVRNCANSGAAFSFFCIFIWVSCVCVRGIRGNKGPVGYLSVLPQVCQAKNIHYLVLSEFPPHLVI